MRTLARIAAVALLPGLAACGPSDPWVHWETEEVAFSDLQVVRVGWDRGQEAEPGADGQSRYKWTVEIHNASTTIWSGRVRVIAELESGGLFYADTSTEQIVVPGRRTVTFTDFGRLAEGAETRGLTPRFKVRIGANCAEIEGAMSGVAPCPEETAEPAPTDVGPPIG